MDDMSEYKEIFLAELSENISLLNSTLIKVEKDPSSANLIQDLVRAAHTVKGMAATMGYENLTTLTHSIESYLLKLKNISPNLIQTLFKAADKLQEFYNIAEVDGDLESIEINDIIDSFSGTSKGTKSSRAKRSTPKDDIKLGVKYNMIIRFSGSTRLLGARGYQAYREIENLCQIVTSDPPISVLQDGELLGDINMEIITYESESKLREVIFSVGDVEEVVFNKLIDNETEASGVGIRDLKKITQKSGSRAIQSVRVNLDRLDRVVDLLGELVITRGRFQSLIPNITPEISEQFQIFDNTISTIQDTVMGLRMVNLSRIFDTYPRAIRDIAFSRNMEIDLLLQGTHIQIDRSVVDQINEALLHLLRNAAIHGIEEPSVRKSNGKPQKGTIRLAASRDRGEVVFEVEDDGGGLDIDNIRAKAIKENLISSEEPLSRSQIAGLIFHPGFSTAKQLTEVAGRGVGMDIVKATIEEISGNIQIRTRRGVGTRFIIRIPQTLAIIDALIVSIEEQLFAIPLLNVEKIYSVKDPAIEVHNNKRYINWEGHNVRIVNMKDKLMEKGIINTNNTEETGKRTAKRRDKIILWERAGKRLGLQVSNILEQREIVTKQLDEIYSEKSKGFSGATILGYDEVALIVDPQHY